MRLQDGSEVENDVGKGGRRGARKAYGMKKKKSRIAAPWEDYSKGMQCTLRRTARVSMNKNESECAKSGESTKSDEK